MVMQGAKKVPQHFPIVDSYPKIRHANLKEIYFFFSFSFFHYVPWVDYPHCPGCFIFRNHTCRMGLSLMMHDLSQEAVHGSVVCCFMLFLHNVVLQRAEVLNE